MYERVYGWEINRMNILKFLVCSLPSFVCLISFFDRFFKQSTNPERLLSHVLFNADTTDRPVYRCCSITSHLLNYLYIIIRIIIYKEMFLGCDWLIRVQLIPNITQTSAKICNTVQKSVTTVQKSVTTVQKSVISSLSDGIYSLKNQKYGGRIFTFA